MENKIGANLFIVGSMKSGTSMLHDLLGKCRNINASIKKEPNYYSIEGIYRKDEDYSKLFNLDYRFNLESSVSYTRAPRAPWVAKDIAAACPTAKIIYMVREPIERLMSQHLEATDQFYEWRKFDEYVNSFGKNSEFPLETSKYYFQISRYLEFFKRENIMIIVLEEFLADAEKSLSELAAFLELPEVRKLQVSSSPVNPRALKRTPNALGRWMARRPVLRKLLVENVLPWKMRSSLHKLCRIGAGMPEATVLTSEIEMRLVSLLADDISKFKGVLGREIPSWKRFIEGS